MGLPYSNLSFSLSADAKTSSIVELVSRINECLVRPLYLLTAVANGGASEEIDPFDLESPPENAGSALYPCEIPADDSGYSVLAAEWEEIDVWGREREYVASVLESFDPIAKKRRSWIWLKFWGPTRLLTLRDQCVGELWALRERNCSSLEWNPIVNVSVHLDLADKYPILVSIFVRSHAFSPFSSYWNPTTDEWERKGQTDIDVARQAAELFGDSLITCLQSDNTKIRQWEYENSCRLDLVGELPKRLAERLDLHP
mgnify:CR=1 FL=1